MTPVLSPKPVPWSEVPDAEKKRLQQREKAHRAETKREYNKPAESVSVEGLYLLQNGCCVCPECKGKSVPLNPFAKTGAPDQIIFAHVIARSYKRSPGHTTKNVELWLNRCNQREAPSETSGIAYEKKHTKFQTKILKPLEEREANRQRGETKQGPKAKIQSAGFRGHRKFNGEIVWND